MLSRVVLIAGAAVALMAGTADAAAIRVNTQSDELNADGDCSIREAVQAARLNDPISGCPTGQNSSRDTIVLKSEEYNLVTSSNEGNNADGDFDVTGGGPLTINGKGPNQTLILQTGDDRVFDISSFGDLTLADMRVNGGDVTSFDSGNARGGNIRVSAGKLTLVNTDVTSGDAFVGGGVYGQSSARVKISKGLFGSNDATGAGGAFALQSGAKGTVERTTFQQSDVTSSTASAEGGVILTAGAGLKLFDTTVQGSGVSTTGALHSARGAGIYSSAPLTVRRSTIRGNTASAATDNLPEDGGGIYVNSGEALIVNSTFFDNRAGTGGDNDGAGGAIYNVGQTDVQHVTFDSNSASDEGDTLASSPSAVGPLTLFGSIIDDATDPCSGNTVASDGFNVSESIDAQCGFVGSDFPGGDPGLGSFADNGGFTETIAIAPTSDAKNRVPKAKCKAATGLEDQRGFARPKGKKCDAGAFELGAQP